MSKGNETSTFSVNLEGNVAERAKQAADAMQAMRDRVANGVNAIKEMNGSLRNLKGSTKEIVEAKAELKARIDAERAAVAKATLEELKAQKVAGSLGAATKKLAEEKKRLAQAAEVEKNRAKAVSSAISSAGGPVASLRDKINALREVMGEGGAGGALALLTLGVGALVAALAAAVVGVAAATAALARFIVAGADAARSAALLRQAAVGGNADWGRAFGEQIDALSKRVPTARADIDRLGRSMYLAKIQGKLWVDSLNAITQASAAVGDEAGNKIKGFIERAMVLGRPGLFRLAPQELIGTGVEFTDVAAELAKSMGVSVKAAQTALFNGRVKLEQGAEAMRRAVEKKFGAINMKQMLSLENISKKLHETLQDLTKDVNLEPLLEGVKHLLSVFDRSTVAGNALKTLVTTFGNGLARAVKTVAPIAKAFFVELMIGALQLTLLYFDVRDALAKMIPDSVKDSLFSLNTGMLAGKLAAAGLAAAVTSLGASFALAAIPVAVFLAPFALIAAALYGLVEGAKEFGPAIIDGLINGLRAGWDRLTGVVGKLAKSIKAAFADVLQIHSPSKVFADFGQNTTKGYEEGIERGRDGVQSAVEQMVRMPRGAGAAGGATGGGAAVNVTIPVQVVGGGPSAKAIAEAVSSPSVIEAVTKILNDAALAAGAAVPG